MRGLSLAVASGGHSSSWCAGLSISRPLLLRSTGSRCAGSVIVAHGPSCSAACGIFPDQGSNPCALHWQADSQPLRHQGSPSVFISNSIDLSLLPFFLVSLANVLSILFIFSKSQLLLLLIFAIVFFISFFFNNFYLFIYFWLCWVFVAACGLSLVEASGGYSSLRCVGFSLQWLLSLWSTGSRRVGFSSCGTRAQ